MTFYQEKSRLTGAGCVCVGVAVARKLFLILQLREKWKVLVADHISLCNIKQQPRQIHFAIRRKKAERFQQQRQKLGESLTFSAFFVIIIIPHL